MIAPPHVDTQAV